MKLPRILLVEDEILIRMFMKKQLEKHGLTVAAETGDSRDVEDLVLSKTPDLVFLDVRLEGPLSGTDLAPIILKRSSAAMVFVSAYELPSHLIPGDPRVLGVYQKPLAQNSVKEILGRWNEYLVST
ncbi:response regulator [Salinispira pacifica]|uniref:Response regulatory domain-containing protein n=1 Tax=Salinispira pacifica TaxID=1307761 RepID=V5WEV8_9SPIO|nr:response regulator [Salinispira pacifica]AHC13706.1 hypothetical protein L21SP2_0264 [Salinispira pacifica]